MNLSEVPSGHHVEIREVLDSEVRALLRRMGVVEGSVVLCVHRLGRGPVVIRRGAMEVSLGRRLAQGVIVSPARETP